MKVQMEIILASASQRRKSLLEQLGFQVKQFPSHIAEIAMGNEDPVEHTQRLARLKGEEVQTLFTNSDVVILSADTIVLLEKEILGKPRDTIEARQMLSKLSGVTHEVVTGFYIWNGHNLKSYLEAVRSQVKFKTLSAAEIEAYILTLEPFDKAGAYGIQGKGGFMVEAIQGSYSNIVGLPVCQVIAGLKTIAAIENYPF